MQPGFFKVSAGHQRKSCHACAAHGFMSCMMYNGMWGSQSSDEAPVAVSFPKSELCGEAVSE